MVRGMSRRWFGVVVLLMVCWGGALSAEETPKSCRELPQNEAASLIWDAPTATFIGLQSRYELAGIHTMTALASPLLEAWLSRGAGMRLQVLSKQPDRWGIWPVRLLRGEQPADDLAKYLLEQGVAFYWDPRRMLRCLDDVDVVYQRAEWSASQAKRGWWRKDGPFLATDSRLYTARGTFQIVRGKVVSVGKTRSTFYLNFGERWTRDFTGIIEVENLDAFRRKGLEPEGLAGKTVEVRGVVQLRGGPEIEIRHPDALRIIE